MVMDYSNGRYDYIVAFVTVSQQVEGCNCTFVFCNEVFLWCCFVHRQNNDFCILKEGFLLTSPKEV